MRRCILVAVLTVIALTQRAPAQGTPRLDLVIQIGHTGLMGEAVLSADGKFALTCAGDSAILWDTATGNQLRTFAANPERIRCAALSADAKFIVTGSSDSLILWQTSDGKRIHSFRAHTKNVTSVAVSRDGKYALSGSADKTAILWEIATGKQLQSYQGHLEWVTSVALSADLRIVLTGSGDGTAILWDKASGKEIRTFRHAAKAGSQDQTVWSVALSSDGKKLALTGAGSATLWDTDSGKKIQEFKGHTSDVGSVAISPDGKQVLTGSWDATTVLWDAVSANKIRTLRRPLDGGPGSVAFSGDGKLALIGSSRMASLCELATGKHLRTFERHAVPIGTLTVSRDGRRVLAGGISLDKAMLWEPFANRSKTFGSMRWPMAVSNDGKKALTPAFGIVILWDTSGGPKLELVEDMGATPIGGVVGLSRDGKLCARGKKALKEFGGGKEDELLDLGLALTGDGNLALTAASFNTAILWDCRTGARLKTFRGHTGPLTRIALSEDGKLALTGSADKMAILWTTADAKKLRTFQGHPAGVNCVAIRRDGKLVLTGSADSALLWNAETSKQLQTFRGHVGLVSDVGITDDGKHVWTASYDGTVRLWDPASGKERCRLYGLDAGKDWLVATPDGLFDGSPGAWKFVTYREPGTLKLLNDDATRRRFHRPGLLAKIVQEN